MFQMNDVSLFQQRNTATPGLDNDFTNTRNGFNDQGPN